MVKANKKAPEKNANSKAIARLELEFIDKSKEVDKYDYSNALALYAAVVAALLPLVVAYTEKGVENQSMWSTVWPSGCLIIVSAIYSYVRFRPIVNDFKKKRKMERARFTILGVNMTALDRELKKTTLP